MVERNIIIPVRSFHHVRVCDSWRDLLLFSAGIFHHLHINDTLHECFLNSGDHVAISLHRRHTGIAGIRHVRCHFNRLSPLIILLVPSAAPDYHCLESRHHAWNAEHHSGLFNEPLSVEWLAFHLHSPISQFDLLISNHAERRAIIRRLSRQYHIPH